MPPHIGSKVQDFGLTGWNAGSRVFFASDATHAMMANVAFQMWFVGCARVLPRSMASRTRDR